MFVGLEILCLFLFSAAYSNTISYRKYTIFGIGIAALIVLYFLGVRFSAFTDVRLDGNGVITDKVGSFGIIGSSFVPLYLIWAMILLWKNVPHPKSRSIEIGLTVLLAGILIGGLFNLPFPLLSISNVICLLLIGNAVIRLQILNPIRDLNEDLQASLKEKEVLLKEIHHRVKNNFSIIASLLKLQAADIRSPQGGEKALNLCSDRIHSMAMVHEQLYQSDHFSEVDMKSYIENLVDHLLSIYTTTTAITTAIETENISVDITQAVPCGLILNELISNAFIHAFPDRGEGRINVSLNKNEENRMALLVTDDGIGMPESFDHRLSHSLGFQLVNILTEQLNGTIAVSAGNGTEIKIEFPANFSPR
jgi:two-component sensor histidine kinase